MTATINRKMLVFGFLICGFLCFAQTSGITGRVADTSGEVVPGVTVIHVDTGVVRTGSRLWKTGWPARVCKTSRQ